MAVAWFRNPVLDESADVIDRHTVNERTFGVTRARRHPAYVYSINKNGTLMHRVFEVEIQHYAFIGSGGKLGRLKQPAMMARTVCGYTFSLTPDRARTCRVPLPDSVLCGRCHGEPATWAKGTKVTKAGVNKAEANVRLGCVEAGYPSALAREDS